MRSLLLYIILSITYFTSAQSVTENQKPISNSIDEQFETLIKEANRYQDYKVVKTNKLLQLKANTVKHINSLNQSINDIQSKVENQQTTIASLQNQLDTSETNLGKVTEEKASISFLGIMMLKSTYNGIVWSIIALLVLGLLFFIYQFKSCNEHTQLAKENLKTVEDELEQTKRKALEKEQRLGRMLQDERNKMSKL